MTFPVRINEKNLTATVLGEEGEGRDFYFRVGFSDGYEDVFYTVKEKLVGLKGEDSQPYADAIRYDVAHCIGLDTDRFWYVFGEEKNGEYFNVWIFEGEEEDEEENVYSTYNVHVKGKYQFHLIRVGDGWMASNRNDGGQVDMQLAQKVEDLLIALL